MATDATGVPTNPDNIPTYNTSVDAPSGLGFNAAMAQLQTIVTQLKAGTLASGKILPAGVGWTGAYPFVNADIAAAAAIAVSKLAPGSNTQVLQTTGGVVVWGAGGATNYRKTTAKTVNTTIAATDLLNAEITLAAGVLGTTGVLRMTAWGDWLNNSGGAVAAPRLVLKLGATTLIDTGVAGTAATGVTRFPFRVVVEIVNLGATNVQLVSLSSVFGVAATGVDGVANLTTGEGRVSTLAALGVTNDANGFNSAAVDTTAALALVLQVINGSASATYETKLSGALVEII